MNFFLLEFSKVFVILLEFKDFKCKYSNIINDKDFLGGIYKNNFIIVKDVDIMGKCMEKCCDSKKCDIVYMVENKCYFVLCFSKDFCILVLVKVFKKIFLIFVMLIKVEFKEEIGKKVEI